MRLERRAIHIFFPEEEHARIVAAARDIEAKAARFVRTNRIAKLVKHRFGAVGILCGEGVRDGGDDHFGGLLWTTVGCTWRRSGESDGVIEPRGPTT
jgi:hypothetical protein